MTSSPRHYQYYLVMGPDFYGSVTYTFFNCIDTFISTYQLAGDTFIMNKYLNGIVTTIYNCYIVGIKGCYIK